MCPIFRTIDSFIEKRRGDLVRKALWSSEKCTDVARLGVIKSQEERGDDQQDKCRGVWGEERWGAGIIAHQGILRDTGVTGRTRSAKELKASRVEVAYCCHHLTDEGSSDHLEVPAGSLVTMLGLIGPRVTPSS